MQGGLNKRNVIGKNKEIQKLEADAALLGKKSCFAKDFLGSDQEFIGAL